MKSWSERPIEIRNLFNPAFCGLVLFRSIDAFQDKDDRGMPFSLSLLVLPLCLHLETREALKRGSRGYFLKVMAEHPQLQVGLARRCSDVLPFSFEALGLLMHVASLTVTPEGRLMARQGVRKTISGTPETIACQRAAAFIGKEFARIADRSTIYATLGLRP